MENVSSLSISFSWDTLEHYACTKVEALNNTDSKWMFLLPTSFSLASNEAKPCFIDISLQEGRILSTECISNARNVESYSEEVKQCLGGGELPAEWQYCETIRGVAFEMIGKTQFFKCVANVPPSRFQSTTHKNHSVRLKLLSIKPNKLSASINWISVILRCSTDSKLSPPHNSSPTTQEMAHQSVSADALQGILSSAMFAVDAKLNAACTRIEGRLNTRMNNLEGVVRELNTKIGVLEESLQQDKLMNNNEGVETDQTIELKSELPVDITEWTSSDVHVWLHLNGFSQFIPALDLVGVLEDGSSLLSLTHDDLSSEELGIDEASVTLMEDALKRIRGDDDHTLQNSSVAVVPSSPFEEN